MEAIAKSNNLIHIIRAKFSKDLVKTITVVLKGFRPRDESKERNREEWFSKYESKISRLKEFNVIITDLIEKIINIKAMSRKNATNGVIGAFRLLQEELGLEKNFNSFKYEALKSLLLYEIRHFELKED